MRDVLLHHPPTKRGKVIRFDWGGDDWEERLDAEKRKYFPDVDPNCIDNYGQFEGVTKNLVAYDTDIVNSNGVAVVLYQYPEHTSKDISEAKKWIRNNRDVVCFYVVKIKELI